jgi:hypothetical protein
VSLNSMESIEFNGTDTSSDTVPTHRTTVQVKSYTVRSMAIVLSIIVNFVLLRTRSRLTIVALASQQARYIALA